MLGLTTYTAPELFVSVTQKDIDGGKRSDCVFCPIAMALHRLNRGMVSVTGEVAHVGHYRYNLPRAARQLIRHFDTRPRAWLEPFDFKLVLGHPSTFWF